MRVIAGSARHLLLKTVEGQGTRPTTDRIKETLFNIINPYIADSKFLDLFAGSGAIGIEALSRGAKECFFVENNKNAYKCIIQNLEHTKLIDDSKVFFKDVLSAVKILKGYRFNIIFMDPPYKQMSEEQILKSIIENDIMERDCLIIIESEINRDFSFVVELGFEIIKTKEYKTNKHVFLKFNN